MEIVERLKTQVLIGSLALIGTGSLAGFFFGFSFVKGLLGGGLVSCALFLANVRVSQQMLGNIRGVGFVVIVLPLIRFSAYSLVLWRAYLFDTVHWTGFTGAVFGLSVVYLITAAIGYTGWDLRKDTE